MEEKNDIDAMDLPDESEKLEWDPPTLLVEDVGTVTQGGTTGDVNPVDDAWYS